MFVEERTEIEEADDTKKLLVAKGKKQFTCHYCKKPEHFKWDCRKYAQAQSSEKGGKHKYPTHPPKREQQPPQDPMWIGNALVAKPKDKWIVDSTATCHMCSDRSMFTELKQVGSDEKVTLSDGNSLDVAGEGTVGMDMLLNDGKRRGCALKKVLYVPELAYNLVSVSRAAEAGKTVHFDDSGCEFRNESGEIIALGMRQGSPQKVWTWLKARISLAPTVWTPEWTGGAQYFLTLLDDKTHYTWVYPPKIRYSNASSRVWELHRKMGEASEDGWWWQIHNGDTHLDHMFSMLCHVLYHASDFVYYKTSLLLTDFKNLAMTFCALRRKCTRWFSLWLHPKPMVHTKSLQKCSFKGTAHSIAPVLTRLLNMSTEYGIFC